MSLKGFERWVQHSPTELWAFRDFEVPIARHSGPGRWGRMFLHLTSLAEIAPWNQQIWNMGSVSFLYGFIWIYDNCTSTTCWPTYFLHTFAFFCKHINQMQFLHWLKSNLILSYKSRSLCRSFFSWLFAHVHFLKWYHWHCGTGYVPCLVPGSHGPLPTAAVLRGGIRGTPWCAPTGLVVGWDHAEGCDGGRHTTFNIVDITLYNQF